MADKFIKKAQSNIKVCLVVVLLLSINYAFSQDAAGELVIDGTYQGDYIYVQNPFNSGTNSFCISKVTVNDQPLASNILSSSAFEIPLEGYNIGDYINIVITHGADCTPRVLNQEALRSKATFELVSIKIEGNNLKWTTKNETTFEPFIVERFKNNKWVPIGKVVGKGPDGFNNYTFEVSHYSGPNRYRVKQRDEQPGRWKFAMPVEYVSEREPITFYPKRVADELFFSDKAEYEIYDSFGSIVKKGLTDKVDCTELEPGIYFLNIDNRTERFLKK